MIGVIARALRLTHCLIHFEERRRFSEILRNFRAKWEGRCLSHMLIQRDIAKESRKALDDACESARKIYEDADAARQCASKKYDDALIALSDFDKAMEYSEKAEGVPRFTYAYASFNPNERPYCWHVPRKYFSLLAIGSEIKVPSKNGERWIPVSRIITTPQNLHHDDILGIKSVTIRAGTDNM